MREKTNINKIRKEKEITTNTKEIQGIIENLYSLKTYI
jgi:hypothetical protein